MSQIAYTVAATFSDPQVAAEWLTWLRQGHMADVIAGGATLAEIVALDNPANAFEVRYRFPGRAAFERYEREFAPRLRSEGLRRFPVARGITYHRTVGLVTDVLGQG